HQTLRRTIDWSYDLLDDAERAVLQRTAVFAGGFDLDAAEVVCATESIDALDVLDLLDRLVDKSLIVADAGASTARYPMLDTNRDYALERLAHDDDVSYVRRTHAAHFARFAAAAGNGLRGRDEPQWIERVERELENLRTAVTWALEHDELSTA